MRQRLVFIGEVAHIKITSEYVPQACYVELVWIIIAFSCPNVGRMENSGAKVSKFIWEPSYVRWKE